MKQLAFVTASLLTVLLSSGQAQAVTFTESDDAGENLKTAQVLPPGTLPLESISGTLSGDADLFQIFLTGGQTFSATTISLETLIDLPVDNALDLPTDLLEDPQLFLFDSSGKGIYGWDDSFGSTQPTLLSSVAPAESGIYYLAIASFGRNPVSAGGKIFPDVVDNAFGPIGPGGQLPITGFRGQSTTSGRYTIALTGVQTAAQSVPEPASVLGILAAAWGASRLRKKNTSQKSAS